MTVVPKKRAKTTRRPYGSWDESEEQIIRDLWHRLEDHSSDWRCLIISRRLNRSQSSVRARARKMGLCGRGRRCMPEESYVSTILNPTPRIPDQETKALPGTEEKILIFMERARLKQCLFHPQDRAIDVR